MSHTLGIAVPPQDVAALIDRGEPAKRGAGEINRGHLTGDQQIAVAHTAGDIPSDNVAASVEPSGIREGRGRAFPCSVIAIAQHISTRRVPYEPEMSPCGLIPLGSTEVTPG